MPFISTNDGVEIFYKDWGAGQPVVFSHGWPLQSDSWESQQRHLADNGFRAIAHDRRGHGRSAQVSDGMDHYADDLAAVIDADMQPSGQRPADQAAAVSPAAWRASSVSS